jgi:hypothetical protein
MERMSRMTPEDWEELDREFGDEIDVEPPDPPAPFEEQLKDSIERQQKLMPTIHDRDLLLMRRVRAQRICRFRLQVGRLHAGAQEMLPRNDLAHLRLLDAEIARRHLDRDRAAADWGELGTESRDAVRVRHHRSVRRAPGRAPRAAAGIASRRPQSVSSRPFPCPSYTCIPTVTRRHRQDTVSLPAHLVSDASATRGTLASRVQQHGYARTKTGQNRIDAGYVSPRRLL